jgi:hypothetical protein
MLANFLGVLPILISPLCALAFGGNAKGMAQTVEHLASIHEALSSNASPAKDKEKANSQ